MTLGFLVAVCWGQALLLLKLMDKRRIRRDEVFSRGFFTKIFSLGRRKKREVFQRKIEQFRLAKMFVLYDF